jgi:putative DNA primase/helicase
MLSQTRVKTRILGQSSMPEMTAGQFITATGNNLTLVGDITRRAILCRLDARHERPELRVFDRDPVALAKARRPEYVAAILTLLHAYNVAGRPGKPAPLGSFGEWSDLVRGAILWLGCADPVDSMELLREADPRRRELETAVSHWRDIIGFDKVTVADVIKIATDRPDENGAEFLHPEFREALVNAAGMKGAINSRSLGNWLAKNAGKVVDGVRFEQNGLRHKVALWQLSRLA